MNNFYVILLYMSNTLVLYKANWCGHCNNLLKSNDWNRIIKWINTNKNKYNISLTIYDSDKHKNIIDKADIIGFPTIRLLNKNNILIEFKQHTYDFIIPNIIKKLSNTKINENFTPINNQYSNNSYINCDKNICQKIPIASIQNNYVGIKYIEPYDPNVDYYGKYQKYKDKLNF